MRRPPIPIGMIMNRLPTAFSLTDLLAYHFPGLLATTAVVLMKWEWTAGVLQFAASEPVLFTALVIFLPYVVGAAISGVSGALMGRPFGGLLSRSDILHPVSLCDEAIRTELKRYVAQQHLENIIRIDKFPENLQLFYICRALIRDQMPRTYITVERQNALRQFRKNLVIPLVLAGIAAVRVFYEQNAAVYHYVWVVAATVAIVLLTIRSANLNGQREVRETFLGFLAAMRPVDALADSSNTRAVAGRPTRPLHRTAGAAGEG